MKNILIKIKNFFTSKKNEEKKLSLDENYEECLKKMENMKKHLLILSNKDKIYILHDLPLKTFIFYYKD